MIGIVHRNLEDTVTRALVIVSYGSSALLAENLAAWGPATTRGWFVVVVDNFSSAAERARITALAADRGWVLVAPDANLGFGDGCAAGVRAAQDAAGALPSAVVLLNPDARISPAHADALATRVEEDPGVVLVPQMVRGDGAPAFTSAHLDARTGLPTAPSPDATAWVTGACLALAGEAWRRLGGFSSDYFLYWEDVDLAWRWQRLGGRVAVAADLRCVHDAGGTQRAGGSTGAKSSLYYYYNCRNRLVFARRHLPARDRVRWALYAPRYARAVVLRGGRRQLLRPWRCVLPAARGTVRGLAALVTSSPTGTVRTATPQVNEQPTR